MALHHTAALSWNTGTGYYMIHKDIGRDSEYGILITQVDATRQATRVFIDIVFYCG